MFRLIFGVFWRVFWIRDSTIAGVSRTADDRAAQARPCRAATDSARTPFAAHGPDHVRCVSWKKSATKPPKQALT